MERRWGGQRYGRTGSGPPVQGCLHSCGRVRVIAVGEIVERERVRVGVIFVGEVVGRGRIELGLVGGGGIGLEVRRFSIEPLEPGEN